MQLTLYVGQTDKEQGSSRQQETGMSEGMERVVMGWGWLGQGKPPECW